jgi:hypothetical protein
MTGWSSPFSERQRHYRGQYADAARRRAGPACPWSRRTVVITAFHPPSTFSVRFVIVLVSTAGEKVHAAGEKVTCEAPGDSGTGRGPPGPGWGARLDGIVRPGRITLTCIEIRAPKLPE